MYGPEKTVSGHKGSLIHPTYLVGSSKKISGGLFTSSSAIASRFLWPPDISLSLVLAVSVRPRFTRISLIW